MTSDGGALVGRWTLPPLILHPFSDAAGPQKLARSSQAGLILEGLMPPGEADEEELERVLLEGRMCEIRMLFYLGKDLHRWIDQCVEFATRVEELTCAGLGFDSFAELLIHDPPASVREKLSRWGVNDYPAIFSRAIALRTLFSELPPPEVLSPEFIRNYFRYTDHVYACRRELRSPRPISSANFDFALYASGEYSRLLEREWA
jgi:hypothetical protein